MTLPNAATSDFEVLWNRAIPYEQFVSQAKENRALWEGVYRTAKIPQWALERACEHGKQVRLLVIAEDWCGDASNTVPVLARLGDLAGCLEMRMIPRDENPVLMDRYLTNGSRSIPIVIALDADFGELGHWGPRPAEIQAWVMEHKATVPSDERYKYVRRWYAKDQGKSTLRAVLALLP